MSRKHELFFTLFWSVRFAASSEHSSPAASIPGALRAPYTFWDFVSVRPAVNSVWPELSPGAIWFCRVLFSTQSFFSQRFWEKSFSSNRQPSLLFAECWLLFSPDWCRVTSFVGKTNSWRKRQRPRNQKLPNLNSYLFSIAGTFSLRKFRRISSKLSSWNALNISSTNPSLPIIEKLFANHKEQKIWNFQWLAVMF